MPDLAQLLKEALELDVDEHAALAERLLASLDELSEREAERLWAQEAQRRLQQCRERKASTISADDFVG